MAYGRTPRRQRATFTICHPYSSPSYRTSRLVEPYDPSRSTGGAYLKVLYELVSFAALRGSFRRIRMRNRHRILTAVGLRACTWLNHGCTLRRHFQPRDRSRVL
jgi:hypothetical protein